MNMIGANLKVNEDFGFTKTSHRKYRLTLHVCNMSQEQRVKLEAALRKAVLSIMPDKNSWE